MSITDEIRVISNMNPDNTSGCVDLLPFTITQYKQNVPSCVVTMDAIEHFVTPLVPALYADGTWIFRKSGEYDRSEQITSIASTDEKIVIVTDKCVWKFENISNFLKRDYYNLDILSDWSMEERESVFNSLCK
jgi:hypothetical protein